MTEARQDAQGGEAAEQAVYSKDYWDLVFEQLGRRRLFQVGMAVLALLYATAIYAPLIANDRPYVLEAVDYKSYGSALRVLSPVASTVERRLKQTPEEYLEARKPEAPATQADALDVDLQAALDRYEELSLALAPEYLAQLEPYREKISR